MIINTYILSIITCLSFFNNFSSNISGNKDQKEESLKIYYVSSSSGSDSYDGLAPVYDGTHGPWKTLNKVSNYAFEAGDRILLKRGDIWRETLKIKYSGTHSFLITYDAYGDGVNPVIDGADMVTEWEQYDAINNIWVSTVNTNIPVSQVCVDGQKQTVARWPNKGWNTIPTTSADGTYLYDPKLNQSDDYWKGCRVVYRFKWTIATPTITSSSGSINKITFEESRYIPTKGFGYYIEGKLEELDNAGEFYFDQINKKLYLALPPIETPDNHIIEASVRNNGIYSNEIDYITIKNINIRNAASYSVFLDDCGDHNISNCNIVNSMQAGIYCAAQNGQSSGLKIDECEIEQVDGEDGIAYGIYVNNIADVQISNNTINHVASDSISPRRGMGIYMDKTPNSVISGNIISNISNNGIMLARNSGPVTVKHNTLFNCVSLLADSGGLYMSGDQTGTIIEHNCMSSFPGSSSGAPSTYGIITVGIYFDETDSHGAIIRGNIVKDCTHGVHLHKSYDTKVLNNTLYKNRVTSISLQEEEQNQMYGNIIKNNICYAESSTQIALRIVRFSTSTNTVGTFDNNLYYNPDKTRVVNYRFFGMGGGTNYSLQEWQTKTGLDSSNDPNSLSVDPKLTDVSNNDFHLTQESPCIDAGMQVEYFEDFDGIQVPQGDAYDIGAFEFVNDRIENDHVQLTAYAVNNTKILINGKVSKEAIAMLYDMQGRTILIRELKDEYVNEIWLPQLISGIYILFVRDNKKRYGFKIPINNA